MNSQTALLVGCLALAAACGRPESGRAEHESEHGDHEHGDHEHDDHEGEAQAELIELDPHVVERNGIETEPAQDRLLLGALEVPAEVQVNPDRTAHVASLVPGRLLTIAVALGERVEQGDVLAHLSSTEPARLRGELAAARARGRAANAELERAEALVGEGIAAKKAATEARARAKQSKAEIATAQASLSVYGVERGTGSELTLRSPISGTVTERHASPGELVDSSTTPFIVADLSQVWVIGRIYEQEIAKVHEGIPAEVALIAYPGRTWTGEVDYVADTLDEDTRTAAIRVVLDNEEGLLRPGMFGTIALALGARDGDRSEVLSVPDTAIMTLEDRTVVFVRGDEPGQFRPRVVVPGARAHGLVEIREGLERGEEVVTSGAFVLKSKLLESSLGEGHAH